jgi:hypothetical protein
VDQSIFQRRMEWHISRDMSSRHAIKLDKLLEDQRIEGVEVEGKEDPDWKFT